MNPVTGHHRVTLSTIQRPDSLVPVFDVTTLTHSTVTTFYLKSRMGTVSPF